MFLGRLTGKCISFSAYFCAFPLSLPSIAFPFQCIQAQCFHTHTYIQTYTYKDQINQSFLSISVKRQMAPGKAQQKLVEQIFTLYFRGDQKKYSTKLRKIVAPNAFYQLCHKSINYLRWKRTFHPHSMKNTWKELSNICVAMSKFSCC